MNDDILFRETAGIAFITLNRPDVLNALSCEMCAALHEKLNQWSQDDTIKAVIINGSGGKAFCAGGDVRTIVEQGHEDNKMARDFFSIEYKMNAALYHFKKPFISLLDGITMGGGVGVAIHGSHRIVTEKTLFAMPESAIGLIPDVGGSYFLPRLPGAIGKYLGLTGARLRGADVLYAGIGTAYISSEKLEDLVSMLMEEDISSDQDVDAIVARFADDPGEAPLDEFRDLIDAAFSETNAEDIMDHLSDIDHDWARETLAVMGKMSPISLKVITEQLNRGAKLEFDDCMLMEYRIVMAISSYASDFFEGVRAVLIDKDHAPNWLPATMSEVSNAMVLAHFDTPVSGDLIL
jgi:enoyl-CoA hydratase